jgi:hypothetical protein
MRHLIKLIVLLVVLAPSTFAQTFTMNESFLRGMIQSNTILPTLRVRMNAHGPLHPLGDDCEMHVGASPIGVSVGTPPAIVVEFPNWCEFNPQGNLGDSFDTLKQKWNVFATSNLDNKTCDVTGFLRIFTEHAAGGGTGGSNPDHAYEFHPALSMSCGAQAFNFGNMLRASPGLRHISTGSAAGCMAARRLQVRFKNNRYEFNEAGGICGNFVIVRVSFINLSQSVPVNGGHYAVVTATADGPHTSEVGLYTLNGTPLDFWLGHALTNGGIGHSTKVIHGVFTYDWLSIIKKLKGPGNTLIKPNQFIDVTPPLAIIAYGEATAPF